MKKIIIIFLIILVFTFVGGVDLAWAQEDIDTFPQEDIDTFPQEDTNLQNPLGESSIPAIIGRIIKAFLGIIGTISLVMFIYAGLMLLTAAGKAEQINKGRQTMVWASLGILVVFASYAILKFVFSAFGL